MDLENPALFINREMSWIRFNHRILEEARDQTHPLLERIKFLAICGSNLDEFFMVRVPGLKRQVEKGALEAPPDGMTPQEQIDSIHNEVQSLISSYSEVWYNELIPELERKGIKFTQVRDLKEKERDELRKWYESNIFPVLTPLTFDVCHPFPVISGLAVNLAVIVQDSKGREKFARVKVPIGLYPRFVNIADLIMTEKEPDRYEFVFLEDLVASNLETLFPGMKIISAYPFRVTRDAEIAIELDEASDLMTAMEEKVRSRRTARPVRLEVEETTPDKVVDMLSKKLNIPTSKLTYRSKAPLALSDLWQLHGINRPDLKDTPFMPYTPKVFQNERNLDSVCGHEIILYHPYDSFQPIVNIVEEAAEDPDVLAIKITLYRIDKDSPIVEALMEARHNRKAVSAVIELKAKFDEMSNIAWARQLEHAGVHVVYGLEELKVHGKLLLIVKKSRTGISRICHISSGNYNVQTSRIYGDLGYLTCDKDIADDVSDLFNTLTGISDKSRYRKLLVSPRSLREGIISRIEREIDQYSKTGTGYMAFKLNALTDKEMIEALYKASKAGIKIDLNVRGLCSLRPGVPGISENIKVTSIVGRFLEHCRIYYFCNGGQEEILIGSSDLMPRNLNRRIEVLVPIQDSGLRKAIFEDILKVHLNDNVKARILKPDGTYERVRPEPGEPECNSQEWLIKNRGQWHHET